MNENLRYEYHDFFYRAVLGQYKDFLLSSQTALKDSSTLLAEKGRLETMIAYSNRPESETNHHFETDVWLTERQKVVILRNSRFTNGLVVTSGRDDSDKITVYKNAFAVFENPELAQEECVELLEKFFDVTVEDRYNERQVDTSSDRRQRPWRLDVN